jgi:hypothetical protein
LSLTANFMTASFVEEMKKMTLSGHESEQQPCRLLKLPRTPTKSECYTHGRRLS